MSAFPVKKINKQTKTFRTAINAVEFRLHYFLNIPLCVHLKRPESNEQRQNGLKMVDQAIWSKKMSNGVRRTPVSAEQVGLDFVPFLLCI